MTQARFRPGARCAGPYWDQRRSSAPGPYSGVAHARRATTRCQLRNGSPRDCDVYHSLAGFGQLREARRGHVDDPRVSGLLSVIDRASRARPGDDVRDCQDRSKGKRRAGAHPRRGGGIPRRLTLFVGSPRRWTRRGRLGHRCHDGRHRRRRHRRAYFHCGRLIWNDGIDRCRGRGRQCRRCHRCRCLRCAGRGRG